MARREYEYPHPSRAELGLSHEEVMEGWARTMRARHAVLGMEEGAHIPEVIAFRRKYLPNGLIGPDQKAVKNWISACGSEAEDAWREDLYRTSPDPLDPAASVAQDQYLGEDPRAVEYCVGGRPPGGLGSLLHGADYPGRDQHGARESFDLKLSAHGKSYDASVRPYGAISELKWLSESVLPAAFGWTPESAAGWLVVLRSRPQIPYLPQSIKVETAGPPGGPYPYIGVTVTIPIDLPSSRLAREWESIQKGFKDSFAFALPGTKPSGEDSLNRMLFAVERNDGRSWSELVRSWNEENPGLVVPLGPSATRQFASQVRRTYQNVMGRPIPWAGAKSPGTAQSRNSKPVGQQEDPTES